MECDRTELGRSVGSVADRVRRLAELNPRAVQSGQSQRECGDSPNAQTECGRRRAELKPRAVQSGQSQTECADEQNCNPGPFGQVSRRRTAQTRRTETLCGRLVLSLWRVEALRILGRCGGESLEDVRPLRARLDWRGSVSRELARTRMADVDPLAGARVLPGATVASSSCAASRHPAVR